MSTNQNIQAKSVRGRCCEYAPDENDLSEYLRHLVGSHPTMVSRTKKVRAKLMSAIQSDWQNVFGGPLKVDFVCVNQRKIQLLRSVMSVSDIVPIVFCLDTSVNDDPSRFRVNIEV